MPKWRRIVIEDFRLTPRNSPNSSEIIQECEIDRLYNAEFPTCSDLELEKLERLRTKKRHSVPKGHRAVRDKHNLSVPKARGKKLYMKVRNYNKIGQCASRTLTQPRIQGYVPNNGGNNHLTEGNIANSGIKAELASFLLELQDREITPEDYERLLLLDELSAASTAAVNKRSGVLARWPSHPVKDDLTDPNNEFGGRCIICFDCFQLDERAKTLLCAHSFHSDCLDNWTLNSAPTCPLDNIPILSMRPNIQGRVSYPAGPLKVYKLPEKKPTNEVAKTIHIKENTRERLRIFVQKEKVAAVCAVGVAVFFLTRFWNRS